MTLVLWLIFDEFSLSFVTFSYLLYIFLKISDDQYNIPKVEDCSKDLNEWVYPKDKNISKLMSTKSRELPECVRRFTQDIYLCVYVPQDYGLYWLLQFCLYWIFKKCLQFFPPLIIYWVI